VESKGRMRERRGIEFERLTIQRAVEADEMGLDFEGLLAEGGFGDIDRGGPVAGEE